MASHGPGQLVRGQRFGRSELAGEPLLVRVTGADEQHGGRGAQARRGKVAQRGSDEEPEGACTDDGHDVSLVDRGAEDGMDRARHRFGGHRVGVAKAVGYCVELARVGDEAGAGPTAARVCAEPGLQARPDVAKRDEAAIADLAGLAGGARRLDPPGHAAEHRLQHDPAAGRQRCAVGAHRVVRHRADHLMAGYEGKRDDVFEIA